MKFNKLGRNMLIAGLSAALGLGTVACSRDYVAAYVYATSSAGGNISAFAVDYQSGILNQVSGSPFASGLNNPISVIAAPDGKHVYVIGGNQDSKIEVAGVGTDGKLYFQQPYDMTGTYPTGAAMDATGKYLYVTYRYQIGFGPANDGPGGVTIFTLDTDAASGTYGGVLSSANVNVGEYPVGIAVTVPVANYNGAVFAYVVEQTTSTTGLVVELLQGAGGALTATGNTISAGVNPSGVIAEPTGRYVYVSDATSNQILGYQILDNTGKLLSLTSGPYATGLYPVGMTIDPRGKYLYVADFNAATVSGYTINHGDGSLGGIVGTTNFKTGVNPTCVTVDPSVGKYLYVSNSQESDISGAEVKSEDGTLSAVANTPFPTSQLPSCLTSVANGSHALSLVYPN